MSFEAGRYPFELFGVQHVSVMLLLLGLYVVVFLLGSSWCDLP